MLNFDFDFGGADLDFDLDDFDVIDQDEGFSFDDRPSNVRYWKPRVDKREILRTGNYRYARDFVKKRRSLARRANLCMGGRFVHLRRHH